MKWTAVVMLGALLLGVVTTEGIAQTGSARIVLSDGSRRVGTIQGILVLRSIEKKLADGKQVYSIAYTLLRGEDIESVDQKGVRVRENAMIGLYSLPSAQLIYKDDEILTTGRKYQNSPGIGGFFAFRLDNGDLFTIITGTAKANRMNDPLLGTLVISGGTSKEKVSVAPMLTVKSKEGSTTIPVGKLPKFR